jgi:diacylglycerol kinase family enzyme
VAAIGALVLLVAGLFTIASGFSEDPLAIIIAVVSILLAIGFGWVALTRRGRDRTRAAWLSVILLVVAFIAAIGANPEGWPLVLGGLAIGGSLLLGRFALGVDRRTIAQTPPPGTPVAAARKPVLLVNPLSGDGKAKKLNLVQKAQAQGIDTRTFGPHADLGDLARAALAEGADVIGVAGGDGSQALVAELVSQAGVQMVCVPSGTLNHFAMDLGLDRSDPLAALGAFGEAHLKTVDLARVNGRTFVNNVSMGLYGEVVQSASYRESKAQTTLEELPSLVDNPPDLRFIGADGAPHSTVQVVHVSNNPYLMEVRAAGARPRLDTGELGIITVELSGATEVADMFARAALGRLSTSAGFNAWTRTRFEVTSDSPIAAGVDGEAVQLKSPAVFEISPGALQVRIPLTAVGRSPAAFVPEFSDAFSELLRRAFLPTRKWRPLLRG